MDPTATLDRILNALDDEDFQEARMGVADLHRWIASRGAQPVLSRSMTAAVLRYLLKAADGMQHRCT